MQKFITKVQKIEVKLLNKLYIIAIKLNTCIKTVNDHFMKKYNYCYF